MRMMVVATQIDVPGTGGGQTHVTELVTCLRSHGPTLLLARRGSTGQDVIGAGILNGNHPPPGLAHAVSLLNMQRAWPTVAKFCPEVIYERGSSYGLGAYLALRLQIPMLVMVLDEHVSPLSLRLARRIISTNPELVPEPFRHKAVKVSWGANTERFHPGVDAGGLREQLALGDGLVVAYTGTMQPWHGLGCLVDAAKHLQARPIRFLMIGGVGDRLARAKELTERAGVADRFVFTGQVPYADVPRYLAAADLCVAPFTPSAHTFSRKQGYALDPLKLFEYLAMAKPTITIRARNIEGLFRDGEEISLVPPEDPEALAAAIGWVADHPDQARAIAQRGYQRVVEQYTWQAHAGQLVHLFEAMAEEERADPQSGALRRLWSLRNRSSAATLGHHR